MTATGTVSRRVGFAVAVVASTLMMAAASAPSPFYPDLEARFDATPAAMTAVFAIYAVVLLGALLTAGSLSDHVGRRPVLSAGFVLLAVSVVAFGHAGSVAGLLVARSLQGLASGVLLSALAATITELEPAHRRGSGAVWNSVAPLVGLAVGATVGGAALTVTPARAMGEVFGALGVAYAVLAAAVWVAPETSPRHEGWRTALRPHLALPRSGVRTFWVGVPALLAGWANGGLYLSLGAGIVASEFGVRSHLWQGDVVGLLSAGAAAAAFLVRGLPARTASIVGMTGVAAGAALALVAIGGGSLPVYLLSVVVAGTGFGASFTGVLRSVASSVGAHERAGVFASVYTVSYLSFGLPAVAAGLLVPVLSLGTTASWYAGAVVLLALTAVVLRVRSAL